MAKKRITVYPAPHTEVRIHVSDEMIEDYKKCYKSAAEGFFEGNCKNCSWYDVKIGDTNMCELEGVHRVIIGG